MIMAASTRYFGSLWWNLSDDADTRFVITPSGRSSKQKLQAVGQLELNKAERLQNRAKLGFVFIPFIALVCPAKLSHY